MFVKTLFALSGLSFLLLTCHLSPSRTSSLSLLSFEENWEKVKTFPFSNLPEKEVMSKIQQFIPDNWLVIHYSIQERENVLAVLTYSKNYKNIVFQPIPSDLYKQVSMFHQSIQQIEIVQSENRNKFIKQSHELYKILIRPIENILKKKDKLLIIRGNTLQLIPFEVLLPTNKLASFQELDFLIKEKTVSYQPSAIALLNAFQTKYDFKYDFLGFAPVFNNPPLAYHDNNKPFRDNQELLPIPESEKEVKEIEALFQKNDFFNNTLLLHEKATKPSLKQYLKKKFRFIHIATHSFADLNNPQKSAIICSPQKSGTHIFYAAEILSQKKIQADLIVLSSCESGIGGNQKERKEQGIHSNFLKAGAANVLFTLWKVDDKTCHDLMVDFYTYVLVEKKTYSEALRLCKLKMLKKKKSASPNLWAPYLLAGN